VSWWWAVGAVVLAAAAFAVAVCVRRVEAERARLVNTLSRLEPLRGEAARLSGDLARITVAAAARRARLGARNPEPSGGAEAHGTGHR
jgi:hypothetical protein